MLKMVKDHLLWIFVACVFSGPGLLNAQSATDPIIYDFNDPLAYSGWTTYYYNKLQPSLSDGTLIGTVTDSNESGGVYFITPPIEPFEAALYPYMEIKIKSAKNYQFDFYWLDDVDNNWVGHEVLIPLIGDGQYHVYQVDLTKCNWYNRITQFRMGIITWQTQPPVTLQVGDNITIDYIKFLMPTKPDNTLELLNLWEHNQVVARLYHQAIGPGSTYRARLLTGGGMEIRSVTGAVTTVGMAEAVISSGMISTGMYTVAVTAFAADNTTQATASKTFEKLAKPTWLKTTAQRQVNVVPAPWTPMTTADHEINCWGRSYQFQGLPFPSQITSQGADILYAPITLQGSVNSQTLAWNAGTFTVTNAQDYKVSYQTSCTGNAADLSGTGYVEFDGMMWFDFQLQLHSPNARIDSLYLDIPVKSANASYYWYGGSGWNTYCADLFTSKSFPFMPYITVSDDERGLCWFTESQENWSINPASAGQLIAGADVNTIRIYLVNVPFTSDNQTVKFSFGLQATPVKPYPTSADDHPGRYCVTDEWRSQEGIYSFDIETMAAYRTRSIATSVLGDRAMDLVPSDSGKRLTLQNIITDCENHGIKDLAYTCLENVNINDDGLLRYGDEWMAMLNGSWQARPPQPVGNSYPDFYPVSTASGAWQDYFLWKVQQAIDQVGCQGLYLDCSDPGSCWNPYLGGGYKDRDGILRPTLTIRSNRELMKRIYALKTTKPGFRIEFHMSTIPAMPSHTFADIAMDGEQFLNKHVSFELTLPQFRAEFMGRAWGIPSNLWVFTKGMPGYFDNEKALAFGILHGTEVNIEPSMLFLDRVGRLNDVMSLFNVDQAEGFLYWKNPPVTVNSTDVTANVYKKNGEALIVLSNLRGNAPTVEVSSDLGRLGLSGEIYAKDYLGGTIYPITNGAFSTTLDTEIRVKVFHLGTIDKLIYPITPQPTVGAFLGNPGSSNFPPEWNACSTLKDFVTTEQPYTPAGFSNLKFDVTGDNSSRRIYLGIEIRATGTGVAEGEGTVPILRLTLNGNSLEYSETPGQGNLVGKTQTFTMNCGVGPFNWFSDTDQAWTVFYYPSFTLPTERQDQFYRPIGQNPLTYVFDITDLAIIGQNSLTLSTTSSTWLSINTLAVRLSSPVSTLQGTVVLQDYTDDRADVMVRVELLRDGTAVRTNHVALNSQGQFTLSNVTSGTYDVGIKAYTSLRKVIRDVTINGNTDLDPVPVILRNGDLDGDNEISSTDLSIILATMDTSDDP
ncbi:MAG: glycoside hydrolase domain-containing protein [Phycisphaerae bacterium]